MKFVYVFIVFLLPFFCYSQKTNLKLTYDVQLMFTNEIFFKAELLSSGKQAVFTYIPKTDFESMGLKGKILTNNSTTYEIVKGFKKNNLVIEEHIPKINWNLTNESLIIGDYECFKATTTFAGRGYTVWYTNDLPISHGVFRLHGLPGAIIKLTDDTFEIKVIATQVQYLNENEVHFDYEEISKLSEVTRNEYIRMIEDEIKELSSKLKAFQPEGFNSEVQIKKVKMIEMPNN